MQLKYMNIEKNLLKKIIKKLDIIHKNITNGEEQIELEYVTECDSKEKYLKLLKERRKLDIIKGFTTKGVHRDDFMIYINKKDIKIFGSSKVKIEPQCFSLKLQNFKLYMMK